MLFNSLEYAGLLIASIGCCWFFLDNRKLRIFLLLAASYVFYGTWNSKYLFLIFLSSSTDYLLGNQIAQSRDAARRKWLLSTSVIVNLGILFTFKYFNFFAAEFSEIAQIMGMSINPWHLDVLLPVGISFYTFQTLSYTIDVYRRQTRPAESYFQYLLFVSFFPQLVAGPIVRARDLLPKLAAKPRLTAEQGSTAMYRIGIGLVKKIAIADFLGTHMVDPVFSNPNLYSSLETLIGIYAYAFQIYCDFSAYSDIAIGSAALLGIQIPENFLSPYRSSNMREFWQRWHISLSTWLRDYLYIPLGGSGGKPFKTYVNLLITMLLGGLWHGASLSFIVWGGMHGMALVLTRLVQRAFRKKTGETAGKARGSMRHYLCIFFTFQFVAAAWVFFRAPSLSEAAAIFASVASGTFGAANVSPGVAVILGLAILGHTLPNSAKLTLRNYFHRLPSPLQAALLVLTILAVGTIARTDVQPFIYFQF